jgi:hypothetical protein
MGLFIERSDQDVIILKIPLVQLVPVEEAALKFLWLFFCTAGRPITRPSDGRWRAVCSYALAQVRCWRGWERTSLSSWCLALRRRRMGAGPQEMWRARSLAACCNEKFEAGQLVQVSLDWPARLENQIALKLVAEGRIVRNAGGQTAITIEKYEFRTRRTPQKTAAASHESVNQMNNRPAETGKTMGIRG